MPYKVAAFYQFAALPDFRALRETLYAICAASGVKGSVLLAAEGVNGTLAGPEEGIAALLDTRNAFEVAMGTFEGALDPKIASFGQFKHFAARHLDPGTHRRIAMFCTGGIRCEKASAHLLARGFEQVYHLKGGILKYLENVPEADSRCRCEGFVFDERASLGHGFPERDSQPL